MENGTGILVPDNGKNNLQASDWQFLSWIYERMIFVYKENPSFDYMCRFKKILDRMEKEEQDSRR